ncbi:unnamed protein product, partial [Closterium sp. NIES-54]
RISVPNATLAALTLVPHVPPMLPCSCSPTWCSTRRAMLSTMESASLCPTQPSLLWSAATTPPSPLPLAASFSLSCKTWTALPLLH